MLVASSRERARDSIQSAKADRLIACKLVEVRIIDDHSHMGVYFFEQRTLNSRDLPASIELIGHRTDQPAIMLDGDPDDGPGRLVTPRATGLFGDHSIFRLRVSDNCLGLVIVWSEDGVREAPTSNVLKQTVVHGQEVVPTLSLQNLQCDGIVSECRVKLRIQELNDVGFSSATG